QTCALPIYGHLAAPERTDGCERASVATIPDRDRLDQREPPVRADRDLGIAKGRVRPQAADESAHVPPQRRGRDVALDRDLDRVDRADVELPREHEDALLGGRAVRKRADPGAR